MAKRTVLVAEDDPGLRALLGVLVEQGGYTPELHPDGASAWDRLQTGGVDIAILDVNMPRMDGLELCRRIRADAGLRKLPILMLTVRAMAEEQISGYEKGADDYLTKPFDAKVLVARLHALERRLLK